MDKMRSNMIFCRYNNVITDITVVFVFWIILNLFDIYSPTYENTSKFLFICILSGASDSSKHIKQYLYSSISRKKFFIDFIISSFLANFIYSILICYITTLNNDFSIINFISIFMSINIIYFIIAYIRISTINFSNRTIALFLVLGVFATLFIFIGYLVIHQMLISYLNTIFGQNNTISSILINNYYIYPFKVYNTSLFGLGFLLLLLSLIIFSFKKHTQKFQLKTIN